MEGKNWRNVTKMGNYTAYLLVIIIMEIKMKRKITKMGIYMVGSGNGMTIGK
ncbi:MAG: hypothetical protein ACQ9MH_13855 [Nitrospinales bacterium]